MFPSSTHVPFLLPVLGSFDCTAAVISYVCAFYLSLLQLIVCVTLATKLVDPPLVNAFLIHPLSFNERKKREAPSRAHHGEVAGSIWCPKTKNSSQEGVEKHTRL